jgi:hypothetical protein
MCIGSESIFMRKDNNNWIKEAPVSKNIGKLGLIISLSKGDNNRNMFRVESIFDIDMKFVRRHAMQAFPVTTSERTREITDQAKNIIGKLHVIKKYMYIGSESIFMRKDECQNEY